LGLNIFVYEVVNPHDYGVLYLDKFGKIKNIIEKPRSLESKLAITGLYYLIIRVVEFAKEVKPSLRGELEITSIMSKYLELESLTFTKLSRSVNLVRYGYAFRNE
jgi:glucose-1-phosphate thymidylyltransferase